MMPGLIYSTGFYYDAERVMAWAAAGWATSQRGDVLEVWGPPSIGRHVDRDIVRMMGCLDAAELTE